MPLFYGSKFGRVHVYFSILDYQSQVFHLHLVKGTFGQFKVEVLFLHPFKYSLSPFLALLQYLSKYEDIVHVNDEPSFCNHVPEGGFHEGLEGGWGIALPEEHDQRFIEAIGGSECGLPFISFLDADVVISPSNVHLGEIFHSFQFVDEGGDEGKWVCVFNHVFIEISIVLAGVEPSIFLLNEEE